MINEISILHALDHPNINQLYEVYETERSIYLVLDLLKGGELKTAISKKRRLSKVFSEMESKKIMKQILEGLKYLHENRIMHRDLKLSNIMFKKENTIDHL